MVNKFGWPDRFRDDDLVRFSVEVTEDVALWWEAKFLDKAPNLFPRELAEQLMDEMPGSHSCLYRTIDPDNEFVALEINATDGAGGEIWFTGQSIDFRSNIWSKDLTEVIEAYQDDHLGTILMGNCFDLAVLLDLEGIKVTAIDAGAYAWVRIGFLPYEADWNNGIKAKIVRKLGMLESVGEVDAQVLDHVLRLLTYDDPVAIRP